MTKHMYLEYMYLIFHANELDKKSVCGHDHSYLFLLYTLVLKREKCNWHIKNKKTKQN